MDTNELALVVREVRREASDVVSLVLADAHGHCSLPAWQPGAHLSLDLPVGRRQYSLCSDPTDGQYRIAVLLSPTSRGGSRHVHEQLSPGTVVHSRPPRNLFPLVAAAEYLFIAGGIGITPILPMVRAIEGQGRPWSLVYGGRSLESMAFCKELSRFGDQVLLVPQNSHGLIELGSVLGTATADAVYCCGPEPLLAAVEAHAAAWLPGRLHVERFTAESEDEGAAGNKPFEVHCQRSEKTVAVSASQSMLNALRAADFDVDSDCEEGICGTCELHLLAGEADHRDDLLTGDERGELILPCVSRAAHTHIVVDL